jgi:hypothetical protein
MKLVISAGLVFAVSVLLAYRSPVVWSAKKENQCFICHTSAQKLIQITREITKVNKGKPGASAKTEGEG